MTIRIKKPVTFKRNQKITAKNILRYDPGYLFRNNEVGVWYDPSDFSTMYQNFSGTIPAALEAPVGLILDKSKDLLLGTELVDTINTSAAWSNFGTNTIINDDSGVKITYVDDARGGRAFLTAAAGLSSDLIDGKSYKITGEVKVATGVVRLQVSTSTTIIISDVSSTSYVPFSVIIVKPSGISPFLQLTEMATNEIAWIRNISVREVPGNHAYQTTSASRPVLSARYNLLNYTEQFDNATWQKFAGSITNTTISDPIGGNTAEEFTRGIGGSSAAIYQTVTLPIASTYTMCIHAKASTVDKVVLRALNFSIDTYAWFDLTSGTVGTTVGTSTTSITPLGSGWYRCTMNFTTTDISGNFYIYPASTNGSFNTVEGNSVYIWGADLRPTNEVSTLPQYQRVGNPTAGTSTTAGVADYDTVGFPPYLRFDGVDDFLVTNNINPGSVDKVQVFSGVRKLSDAARGILVELGNNLTGSFQLNCPPPSTVNYSFGSRGSNVLSETVILGSSFASPLTSILTGIGNISSDIASLRINGTQVAESNSDQGTGNYLEYPLYIGRRGGTSLPFNGRLYSLIVRFSSTDLDTNRLLNTEKWVSGKTGIPYPVNIDRALSEILFDRSENTIEDVSNSTIVSKR